ncbi:hypothetical protein C6500_03340 [Candidatus Poribacteria bacterium]|nr:MAG: hypothetical protein C6500_03340 [Candidatus Poribacteria bacterium]
MHIVRLSLICLVAFAFMVGCGMLGKQAEMSESTVEETAMESDMKGDTAEAMEEAAIEEITLNVTGMT